MSNNVGLGNLIVGKLPGRDAIHVAVTPMAAGENLEPGERVHLIDGKAFGAMKDQPAVGIVDPYLTKTVNADEVFWLLLKPGTITSMRHAWQHPAFPVEGGDLGAVEFSEAWLRDFAERAGTSYGELIETAETYVYQRDRYREQGRVERYWPDHEEGSQILLHHDLPDFVFKQAAEMWKHIGVVTGLAVGNEDRGIFTCSCP